MIEIIVFFKNSKNSYNKTIPQFLDLDQPPHLGVNIMVTIYLLPQPSVLLALNCTLLYSTLLYCTVLCAVLYCTVMYCTVLYTVQLCSVYPTFFQGKYQDIHPDQGAAYKKMPFFKKCHRFFYVKHRQKHNGIIYICSKMDLEPFMLSTLGVK